MAHHLTYSHPFIFATIAYDCPRCCRRRDIAVSVATTAAATSAVATATTAPATIAPLSPVAAPVTGCITMSQSRFLREEYSKKIHQAANNAAINVVIVDLVAARNVHHADGGKRLIKSSHSYKNVIASLQSVGVNITYDALMKRVSRASIEDSTTEIRLTNTSTESVVSSLSPHTQSDDSLTSASENMVESTSHEDLSLKTPELKSVLEVSPKEAQRPRRSKTGKTNLNAQMPLFWNTPNNTMLLNLLEERWNMGTWKG